MSFVSHLEELRWTLFRSIVAIGVFGILAFLNKHFVFETIIFGPAKSNFLSYQFLCNFGEKIGFSFICISDINFEIVNLSLAGQFMTHLMTSVALGFILAFPYLIWEIWKFIKPGLTNKEVNASRTVIGFSGLLFFTGVLFGYFVLVPFGVNFLTTYSISQEVLNTIDLTNYINVLTMFVLASGIMFQLPILVYLLTKIGMVNDAMMKEHRKHAVVVIFMVAAIITPADIGTMVVVAIPLWFLYEMSIYVSAVTYKNLQKNTSI
ncbi:MAG: twin-arginine translocase subunit TatC [Chitinophagales bacterium]